jgi:hypothetical protein
VEGAPLWRCLQLCLNSNGSSRKDIYQIEFETQIKPAYPKRDGDQRWQKALSHYRVARKAGEPMQAILEGVHRYALWLDEKGRLGTETVKQAATFFGNEKSWREPWSVSSKLPGGLG